MSVYIFVNEELNMSKGKIVSQAGHAILEMHRFLINNNIDHSKWTNSGEKIVTVKISKQMINNLLIDYNDKLIKPNTFNIFPIYDAGRTEVEPGSLTVIVSTPISNDKKPDFIKKLKLL
jgi:peptidyl-tRNA hydrolase